MEIKLLLKGLWIVSQYLLWGIGIYQVIKWLLLLTPWGKKIKFRYEIYTLAHDAQNLFFRQNNYSIPAYLSLCNANNEGIIISDWWYHTYYKSPSKLRAWFSNPEEILGIMNRSRDIIKETKNKSKTPQHKEIYPKMATQFNLLSEELEKIIRKFPDFSEKLFNTKRINIERL